MDKSINEANAANEEHTVIVRFNYLEHDLNALHKLKYRLEEILTKEKIGEYDGHEIASDYSKGFLYMYGSNAETLFKIVRPILQSTDFTKDATARLIFGAPGSGAKEIEVDISQ